MRDIQVLALMYSAGAVTRCQIAEATGMNPTSVTRMIADLAERDLVRALGKGKRHGARGRPAERLAVEPNAGRVVGLEFGRNHLAAVTIDASGQVLHREVVASPPAFEMSSSTISELSAVVTDVSRRAGHAWDSVRAVGVAIHDVVNAEGGWITHSDPSATPFPMRQKLEHKLRRYVLVEDVSRAFAHAEHSFGAGRGSRDTIYLFIGKHRIGGGIYLNDQMLMSSTGLCGEIGHVVVEDDGLLCQCGSRGCLETVASPARIVAQFQDYVARGVHTSVVDVGQMTFVEICRASGEGDKAAQLAFHSLATALARALASTVNICGALTVIIGGPLRLAGDGFLGEVAASLKREVIAGLSRRLTVKFAELPEHAGAWGAAGRALDDSWARGEFVHQRAHRVESVGTRRD